jgi:hypothetical protein
LEDEDVEAAHKPASGEGPGLPRRQRITGVTTSSL